MSVYLSCDWGAVLFGCYFDDPHHAFCIAFGPLLLAFCWGGENGDEAFA